VKAEDIDNDTLSYTYSTTSGTIEGTGSSVRYIAPNSPGVYKIEILVSDGQGGESNSKVDVGVIDKEKVKMTVSENIIKPGEANKTSILFKLNKDEKVTIEVYDIRGVLVKIILKNKKMSQGTHSIDWLLENSAGISVAPGVYIIKVKTKEWVKRIRVVIVR